MENASDIYAALQLPIYIAQFACLIIYGWYLAKSELKKEIATEKYTDLPQAFFKRYGMVLVMIAFVVFMVAEGIFMYTDGMVYGRQWSPELGRYLLLMDGNIIDVFISRNLFVSEGSWQFLFMFLVYALTKSRVQVKK